LQETVAMIGCGVESRRKGLSIKFSRRMPEIYPRAIALTQSGRIKLSPRATHRFSLDQAPPSSSRSRAATAILTSALV
jgi:L-iditol 2-dehydrogenase